MKENVLIHDCMMLVFRVPDVTIATDVICGFPTETAEVDVTYLLSYFFILLVCCIHSVSKWACIETASDCFYVWLLHGFCQVLYKLYFRQITQSV